MLDQRLVQLMQRLLEEEALSTPLRAVSRRLKDDFNIVRGKGQTLYLGERELHVVGGQCDVAGGDQTQASAERAAVHARDGRLRHLRRGPAGHAGPDPVRGDGRVRPDESERGAGRRGAGRPPAKRIPT